MPFSLPCVNVITSQVEDPARRKPAATAADSGAGTKKNAKVLVSPAGAAGATRQHHLWWGANGQPFAWNEFPFAGVSRSLVNRLPGHREICTKTRLAVNLRAYAATHLPKKGTNTKTETKSKKTNKEHLDEDDDGNVGGGYGNGDGDRDGDGELFFPLTFVVHAGKRTPELDAFKKTAAANQRAAAAAKESNHTGAVAEAAAATDDTLSSSSSSSPSCGVWIVKPGASNRGRGIEVFSSVSAVEKHLGLQEYGSSWIVQKYIEAPILVHGRKFDIRQFVMVTPDGGVHMYRDSYVRTCSAQVGRRLGRGGRGMN